MSKPVRISYAKRDTIKIGDFESITPSWSEEWELGADDNPAEERKALVTTVEKMFATVVRRTLRHVIDRRVNLRDEETEEYMDEVCDYFEVKQGRPGGRSK